MKIVSTKHNIPPIYNRKNEQQIKIVVSAQNNIINTLASYKKAAEIKQPSIAPPPVAQPNRIVTNKGPAPSRPANPNRKPKVIYKFEEPPADYKANILKLVNIGEKRILVVVGNGPSVNEVELDKLSNRPKIDLLSINKPDPRVWPTKFWSFYDTSQLRRHEDLFNAYEGILLNSTSIKRHKNNSTIFRNIGGMKFSRDLISGLCIGRTSCFATIQLALWMKYDRIYFFGVDMDPEGIDGRLHFYGTNPDVDPSVRKTRFKFEAEYFDFAADNMEYHERKRFFFCSSYLNWPFKARFNHLDHKLAIDEILKYESTL